MLMEFQLQFIQGETMKIKFLTVSFIMLCAIIKLSIGDILPEVKKDLIINLPSNMNNNAFIGLLAIEAPLETSPFKVGRSFIINKVNNYNEAIKKHDINLFVNIEKTYINSSFTAQQKVSNYDDYLYYTIPCNIINDNNCINKILDEKEKTLAFIENSILLKRYKEYLKLPIYESITDGNTGLSVGGNYIRLLHLHLKEAIYLITDNRVDDGLNILQSEVNFARKVLSQNKNLTLEEYVLFNISLKRIYAVISQLLDNPALESQYNNQKLIQLIESIDYIEQHSLLVALVNYRAQAIRLLYMDPDILTKTIQQKTSLLEKQLYINDHIAFDTNKTINLLYTRVNNYIKELEEEQFIISNDSPKTLDENLNKQLLTIKQLYDKHTNTNIGGRLYVENKINNLSDLVFDQYNTVSYLNLVQIKFRIKQSQIKKEDVPESLKRLGDKALNPYTKKVVIWDDKKQILSYEQLNKENDQNPIIVYINFL